MTVDQLIAELQNISAMGNGDLKVDAYEGEVKAVICWGMRKARQPDGSWGENIIEHEVIFDEE